MRLVTGEEMRLLDGAAIKDYQIPAVVLMENAGLAVLQQVQSMLGEVDGKKIVVFVGSGNNGGDGLVAARHLYNKGAALRIFLLANAADLTGDTLLNYQILQKMGVEVTEITAEQSLLALRVAVYKADLVIDAILGTGLIGEVRGLRLAAIKLINEAQKTVLACDIPSGLSAKTGQPLKEAVKAACTVTFAFAKLGLVLPEARGYVGELVVADISLPAGIEEILPERRDFVEQKFCRKWLRTRAFNSHKGDFGRLLMVAGAPQMPGAPVLAAHGALQLGIGLLTAAVPSAVRSAFSSQVPEAMILPCQETAEGLIKKSEVTALLAKRTDALLIGPGLGRDENTVQLVKDLVAGATCPILLDADGLYVFNNELQFLSTVQTPLVLTPHCAELAGLLGTNVREISRDRLQAAVFAAAESNAVVVLKGARTVTATPEGRIFINSSGNPGMAAGGSGDVLSGMISALLAQKMPPAIAAALAVYLHGAAGDLAAKIKNQMSMTALDIAEAIAAAYNQIVSQGGKKNESS